MGIQPTPPGIPRWGSTGVTGVDGVDCPGGDIDQTKNQVEAHPLWRTAIERDSKTL
jgi:hypothetical protein